jgi:tetratricopeptide (TPR) repeat protein
MRKTILLMCVLGAAAGSLRAAEQPPIQVTSPHFVLVTDAGEKQARHILDNFERMRWMFQVLFPKANVDPPAPIQVIATKNRKGFQTLEPADYLTKGKLDLAGLFLITEQKNYVLLRLDADADHPFATVYHEYTHLQFRSAQDWMPLWLNEGLAEFFQNTEFRDKEVLLGQPSTDDILYLRQNSIIPLATLFRVDHNSPYYHEENKGSVFYSESWALTHYLQVADKQNHIDRVSDYVSRMSRHEDPVIAAQEAFGDLKKLQEELSGYIRGAQYKQFVLNSASAPVDSAAYKVRTLTQVEFDAERGDFLANIGRTQEARTLLQSVMAADPKNAEAREAMGSLELHANDQAAALKWYEEAVRLNSQSYLAHYYFATLDFAAASQDPRIETSLRTAIQLNPNFAPAYDQLAQWYSRKNEKLEEAQSLNRMAIQLDHTNLFYRLSAASLLMVRDKLDDADRVLDAARQIAKTQEQQSMIADRKQLIASIRSAHAHGASPTVFTTVAGTSPDAAAGEVKIVAVDAPPKHPVEQATGAKHTILGSIQNVQCDYPSYLELQVQMAGKPKPVALYISDYRTLDLSALGFEPKKEMNPCHDLAGFKANVQYAESSDKTIDGQIVSIELHK